jgi:hypothetical protein
MPAEARARPFGVVIGLLKRCADHRLLLLAMINGLTR